MSARRDDIVKVDADGEPYIEMAPGVKARVCSHEEAEHATFVVCGSVSGFPDDVWTTCAHCARAICHRPHAPVTPPKVCLPCAVATST